MMKKNKIFFMEHVWILFGLVSLGFAVHATINQGFKQSYVFLIMVVVCGLMFLWRRYARKKDEEKK